MDLDNLSFRDISIGARTGHYTCLRSFLIKKLSLEQVAIMTDDQCEQKL
jgi:hypothetical protein